MLDIKNMSEEDKLFNFMLGLQGWAQAGLRRSKMVRNPKGSEKRSGKELKKMGESSKSRMDSQNTRVSCFICKGSHYACDCPRREKINPLAAVESDNVEGNDDTTLWVAPFITPNGWHGHDSFEDWNVGEVPMEDYDMILRLEFYLEAQVSFEQPEYGLGKVMETFLASLMEDMKSGRFMEELVEETNSMERW
ncbi:hypothetical protein FEM48_Zijuj01G0156400 [Ziziphus jujuba var. spinosa]|uniref:Eukaryotic translation initiation factor 3 subunit G N-terminal domain-containing protein n=1 Tax=Ziziphus jujuba var. spinosa TaxID=714518 RepID=A0A978W235_ZIZJJ|nr:hypothetical protein FEM48_Zijuj01G0156400 [Ziziphus jujuba var. spinosa]